MPDMDTEEKRHAIAVGFTETAVAGENQLLVNPSQLFAVRRLILDTVNFSSAIPVHDSLKPKATDDQFLTPENQTLCYKLFSVSIVL